MMPATSQTPKNLAKLIGPAKMLLDLLVAQAPADWTDEIPTYVANGNIVTDAHLAERLDKSLETVARWRRILRVLGLIDWLSNGRQGRVFHIAAGTRAIAEALKFGGPKADSPRETGKVREWLQ